MMNLGLMIIPKGYTIWTKLVSCFNLVPQRLLLPKARKKIYVIVLLSQITMIACGSATGQVLPPFIIFAAKQLNLLWTMDEVCGSR